MKTGTHHFTSEKAARWYYSRQEYTAADVAAMIADGTIAIGKPATNNGQRAVADHEGRYWLIERKH